MMMENLYHGVNQKAFDPRGIFIIQSEHKIWIWIGSQLSETNRQAYLQKANSFISVLQQNERGAPTVDQVEQF